MGLAHGIGIGIPFKKKSSGSWQTYWTPQKKAEGELAGIYATGRDGTTIPASIGTNPEILLPYYTKIGQPSSYLYYQDVSGALSIGASDFTMMAWIKTDSLTRSGVRGYYLFGRTNEYYVGYCLRIDQNGKLWLRCAMSGGDGVLLVTGDNDIQDLGWHFVGFTYNHTTGKAELYVDKIVQSLSDTCAGDPVNVVGSYASTMARESFSNEQLAPISISDTFVYHRLLNATEIDTLYNRGTVAGATLHLAHPNYTGNYMVDCSGNGHHYGLMGSGYIAYSVYGSRQSLDKGYDVYKLGTQAIRKQVPKCDDETTNTWVEEGWLRVRSYAGNLTRHNLASSYINIPHASFDRSNTTIWSASARGTGYMAANPNAWFITDLKRFNLYYWANVGYRGLCFVKSYPNSFNPAEYLHELFAYNIDKSADARKVIYLYTGDYEAELLEDTGFSDALSSIIWKHPWSVYLTFTGGKANYIGASGLETGCLRQYIPGSLVTGQKYRLRYRFSDYIKTYSRHLMSGNAIVQFDYYVINGWQRRTAGYYEEVVTCTDGSDNYFELQMGIEDANDGQFSIDDVSCTIVEDV